MKLIKLIKDATRIYNYPISNDLHSQKLGEYYFVFDEERVRKGKDQANIQKFDKNGVPYYKYTKEYYPISVGQMGLSVFHTYLKMKSKDVPIENILVYEDRFMEFVDWFYDEVGSDGIVWNDTPLMHWSESWKSSFAQSRAISILLRGYQLTQDKKYLKRAWNALNVFDEWDDGFYKEYPDSCLLDGHIFSLLGIYDFVRAFPKFEPSQELWAKGLSKLIEVLPDYDMGYWSRYGLGDEPSAKTYQMLHINQMLLMYRLTGNPLFYVYRNKFLKQLTFKNLTKAYYNKWKALK